MKPSLDFFKITGIRPFHPTNRLKDRCIRKDKIFDALAEKVFDNPRLLVLLRHKIKQWLRREKTEFTYALAGYIYYCNGEFEKAEEFFLKTARMNPANLDNWFDLAFSLYHQEKKKHRISKKILFNFDHCVKIPKNMKITLSSLESNLGY